MGNKIFNSESKKKIGLNFGEEKNNKCILF